ncbi:MAG: hypothetical protein KAI02_04610 [Gammaproteobacteria bacterium]|nr:hypothetical protein [Gammaproteobacteria bacterium]
MQIHDTFLFNDLPEQTVNNDFQIFMNEKSIDKWFNNIPLANHKVSLKSIYISLKFSNEAIIPYKKRLYFLEKLHLSIIDLANQLTKNNLHHSLPLNEKQQRTSLLIQNLHLQLIIGYKFVLHDIMKCNSFIQCPKKQSYMTLIIERIIRHHSLSLISTYQFYQNPANGQWSDIHNLFILAHNENLLDKVVVDQSLFNLKKTTIKNLYLQIILLAIADPYNLSQLHIVSIFNQLEEWSALAEIRPYQGKQETQALVIDLSNDHKPSFISINKPVKTKFLWELGTLKLTQETLSQLLKKKNTQNVKINNELLEKISSAWQVNTKRHQNRNHSQTTYVNMVIGLNHVYNNFTHEKETHNGEQNKNNYNSHYHSKNIEIITPTHDIWETPFQYEETSQDTSKKLLQSISDTTSRPTLYKWQIVNESPGGYSLLWNHSEPINAKVGKVIALCHESNAIEKIWLLGTIRWLKCIKNNKIQVGIHIIGNNPQAVQVSKALKNSEGLQFRAILLPKNPILKQPSTLITTALGYKENESLILEEYALINNIIKKTKTKILLTKCLESSPHFLKFAYQPTEGQQKIKEKQILINSADNDSQLLAGREFDEMWGDL